jgi:hypothetical protein
MVVNEFLKIHMNISHFRIIFNKHVKRFVF